MKIELETCQCCQKPIEFGKYVVEVRYGKMGRTGHPHWITRWYRSDFFHATCEVEVHELMAGARTGVAP